ncbi:hypothetical protein GIB67_033366 [Kingdonia uniflora]|uniref:Uncharacterized protein n=1 Tax=Kingdonia uniflora TaxID=39325 RepID=A0A7J7LTV6_9MAGN|nr:hypothetical protein GIB67_033366 [Kingdonia uniflora]
MRRAKKNCIFVCRVQRNIVARRMLLRSGCVTKYEPKPMKARKKVSKPPTFKEISNAYGRRPFEEKYKWVIENCEKIGPGHYKLPACAADPRYDFCFREGPRLRPPIESCIFESTGGLAGRNKDVLKVETPRPESFSQSDEEGSEIKSVESD